MTARQRLFDFVQSIQDVSGARVRRVYAPPADVAKLTHELGCEAVFVSAHDGRLGVAVHVATTRSWCEVQVYSIH